LRRRSPKWTRKPRFISYIQTELVFRGAHQECTHNCNEIRAFLAELVFRQIPRKSAQRSWQSQWLRGLFLRAPLLNPVPGGVLRVLRTPVRLCPLSSRRLALRLAACVLALSHPRVRTEPMAADRAGSFPGRAEHGESSIMFSIGKCSCSLCPSNHPTGCVHRNENEE
jgi:hypothetical protein